MSAQLEANGTAILDKTQKSATTPVKDKIQAQHIPLKGHAHDRIPKIQYTAVFVGSTFCLKHLYSKARVC